MLLGIGALWNGSRSFAIAVIVIVVVNMVISPTFWVNIAAGSHDPAASGNRMVTYINVLGVLFMLGLLIFKKR